MTKPRTAKKQPGSRAAATARRPRFGIGTVRTLAAAASLIVTVLVFIAAVPALISAGEAAGLGWASWTAPFIVDAALVMLILGGMVARAHGRSGAIQYLVAGLVLVLSAWLQLSHLPVGSGPEHVALALAIPVTLAAASWTFETIVFAPIIDAARTAHLAKEAARLRAAEKAEADKAMRQAAELRRSAADEERDQALAAAENALLIRAVKSGDPERIAAAQASIEAGRQARSAARDADVEEAKREIARLAKLSAAADGRKKPARRRAPGTRAAEQTAVQAESQQFEPLRPPIELVG